jgi:hypothetical protein
MDIKQKKIKMIIFTILFKIILDFSYIYYINPIYAYMGFTYDLNFIKLIESYLFVAIILFFLPSSESKPSSIALNVLNIVMIIPLFSLYALKNEDRLYAYAVFFCFILTILILKKIPKISYDLKFSMNKFVVTILIFVGFVVYGSLIALNGIPTLELLNFNNVYKVRGNVNYGPSFIKYLVSWQATIINIFFIIISWVRKEKIKFITLCTLQLVLYLITSHKAFLFYPIIIPIIMLFIKNKHFLLWCIYGTILTVVSSLVLFFNNISVLPASLFINRTLYLPAQLSFQYYEYFSTNGLVLLSHSIFSSLFQEPVYETNPILVIGSAYYTDNWANTGYLGDAYMNFGISGMVVYSILFAFILMIIDSLANTEFKSLITKAFIVIMMLSFTNGALLTNLLYGGVIVYMILLLVYDDGFSKSKQSKTN